MKTFKLEVLIAVCLISLIVSCTSSKSIPIYMDTYAPEEMGLNMVKITDESSTSVIGGSSSYFVSDYTNYMNKPYGVYKNQITWYPYKTFDISPDGKNLAHISKINGQYNVMVRNAKHGGVATQRTFRNSMTCVAFGYDGKIYFNDIENNGYNSFICSVNAEIGSLMSQHSNGSVYDRDPAPSVDGNELFFVRDSNSGPCIWSLDKNGTLTMCAKGYNPCLIKNNKDAFYCVRNTSDKRAEIWYVDFVNGKESVVLSDQNRSFTNPCLSPDGKWILCVGNSKSNISNKQNLDIFVVRTDGSQLTQLTYHPEDDINPIWSPDGEYIFFISARANKEQRFNIWRMKFNL